ncbi:formimidoylglutamase [Sphingobacterium suaedae]|uniref:Formimidoylglutamase n=1 Tax=Sphingobacterium suaedae TaxID=1686402 RepID=A0ABW5KK68_9SPHI
MKEEFKDYYIPGDQTMWSGRVDGTTLEHLRWHQVISTLDMQHAHPLQDRYVLVGFSVDEGVFRNGGRTGAAAAPDHLRGILANLPLHHLDPSKLCDAGTICCPNRNLEEAQQALAALVSSIRKQGGIPLVLGGGHEVVYGHYKGIRQTTEGRIGVINFDAHFDLRMPTESGANSGTGFYQIAGDEAKRGTPLSYLALGINLISNTRALFHTAKTLHVQCIESQDFHAGNQMTIAGQIDNFLREIDHLYLTVDLDVFASPFAPGVSAPAYRGILPDTFFYDIFDRLIKSPKFLAFDIAELNPQYDIDSRTARLAADLLFRVVQRQEKK